MESRFKFKTNLIDIDIPVGINIYDDYSATGKTHLIHLVESKQNNMLDGELNIYTVTNHKDYTHLMELIAGVPKNSLIILDRFNLWYSAKLAMLIYNNRDRATFLIDYKGSLGITTVHRVYTQLKRNGGVKVSDDNDIRRQLNERFKYVAK